MMIIVRGRPQQQPQMHILSWERQIAFFLFLSGIRGKNECLKEYRTFLPIRWVLTVRCFLLFFFIFQWFPWVLGNSVHDAVDDTILRGWDFFSFSFCLFLSERKNDSKKNKINIFENKNVEKSAQYERMRIMQKVTIYDKREWLFSYLAVLQKRVAERKTYSEGIPQEVRK